MSRRAFTLIELLVVIAIIALLSSVVLASLNSARSKSSVAAGLLFDDHAYHAIGDSQIIAWKFDEGTGSTVYDSSGNGNDASISGALGTEVQWVPGLRGSALKFDGTNGYVTKNVALSNTSGTVSMWVKDVSPNAITSYLFRSDVNNRTYLSVQTSGSIGYIKGNPAVGVALPQPKPGQWTHIALEWWQDSGSVMHMAAYENGVQSGTTTFTDMSAGSYVTVAAFSQVGTQNAIGTIDEVRIYSRALSASEIGRLYAFDAPRYKLADGVR